VIYERTPVFSKAFRSLPPEIQERARTAIKRFKENPRHPALQVKKMKGRDEIWEARITQSHRFTFHYTTDPDSGEQVCMFRNIGPHSILDTNP